MDSASHFSIRISNPRFSSEMTSCDMASTVHRSLGEGHERAGLARHPDSVKPDARTHRSQAALWTRGRAVQAHTCVCAHEIHRRWRVWLFAIPRVKCSVIFPRATLSKLIDNTAFTHRFQFQVALLQAGGERLAVAKGGHEGPRGVRPGPPRPR